MTRRNISLPDDLDAQARDAGLNVSALARHAIVAELDRRERVARLDAWLDELDAEHEPPSARAMAAAQRWAESAAPVEPRPRRSRRTTQTSTATSPTKPRRAAS